MNSRVYRTGAAAFVFFVFLFCLPLRAQPPGDAAALFKAKCAVCHGANGDAKTAVGRGLKMRDLRSSEVQKQTDAQLVTITSCGKRNMPGYEGKLTGDQITQLVAYMRSLAVPKQP
jgi:cytochrome c6